LSLKKTLSLFTYSIIQGAVSLWSYTAKVPYRQNLAGYFHPIISDRKVSGPIITTQSRYDNAVRVAYPVAGTMGLGIGQDINFDVSKPSYPGVVL
jgi:hypothetical protein